MNKEKITDKIRKLLALSKSDNEHEASLALRNANKLLMKHNLEMKDIEDQIDMATIVEEDVMSGGRIMNWKSMMLKSIMDLNNCELLISSIRRGTKTVKAIGKKQNIEVSVSIYHYLIIAMERKLSKDNPRNKQSFRLGFAHSISSKIREIIRERDNSNINVECTALVIQEKRMARDFMDSKYNNLVTQKSKSSYRDSGSFQSGMRAGQSTSLSSQLN